MFQVDVATAISSLPTPAAASTPGFFTNGNPVAGIPATVLEADFTNMLMMELVNVVLAGGLTPSKTTYTQVRDAIKRLGQTTVVLADTGTANAYTAVNATPLVSGTWVDGIVQAVKIAHANTGASTYAPDGLTAIPIYGLGSQPLQGGELVAGGTAILMHATIAGVNSGNPVCVLMECAGGAQQIAPATQSNQAVNLGQFASSQALSGYTKLPNGLIVQWMTGVTNSSGLVSQAWPIAFPNNLFAAVANYVDGGTATASNIGNISSNANATTCAVNAATAAGAPVTSANIRVIAIGN